LGVVLRLSRFLDCEGRALGENGFASVIGSAGWTSLLLAVVTIFVALIGYRMLLGRLPTIGDGVGWALRLGIVLTLVTGWSAFQLLFYRTAVETLGELAAQILPAAQLPSGGIGEQVQAAYDRLRLGPSWLGRQAPKAASAASAAGATTAPGAGSPAQAAPVPLESSALTPLPQTALLLAISTAGLLGGLQLAIGSLLALGPLASLALLFNGTMGFFAGWLRALVGASIASLMTTMTAAVTLAGLDAEFARLAATRAQGGLEGGVDPGAPTVTVAIGTILALVAITAAFRLAGGFRFILPDLTMAESSEPAVARVDIVAEAQTARGLERTSMVQTRGTEDEPVRAAATARALELALRREERSESSVSVESRSTSIAEAAAASRTTVLSSPPLGLSARRLVGRTTRSALQRDRRR
jgi:type IV secretion system protein VirB6